MRIDGGCCSRLGTAAGLGMRDPLDQLPAKPLVTDTRLLPLTCRSAHCAQKQPHGHWKGVDRPMVIGRGPVSVAAVAGPRRRLLRGPGQWDRSAVAQESGAPALHPP